MCNPIDGSPPGSPIPGILQARTPEWGAISFSNEWKWKVKVKSLSLSDSLRPHGLQPTRLLHPWDSSGKSTGVGYREAWPAAIHGVAKSWTRLNDWTELNWTLSVISQLTWGINGYTEKAINNKGQRLHVAHTVKNINFLTLYRKRFANPVLIVLDHFSSEFWLGLANERHQEKLRVIGKSVKCLLPISLPSIQLSFQVLGCFSSLLLQAYPW